MWKELVMNVTGEWTWDAEESGSAMINITSTNETLTCAGRSLKVPIGESYPPTLAMVLRVLNIIFYLILTVVGITLNSLLLLLVLKFKKLQTLSVVIALQVVITDLINAAAILPLRVLTAAANQWLFGAIFCVIHGYISLLCNISRLQLMLVLVIDRFSTVFLPFSYPKYRKKVVGILSLLSWLVDLVLLCQDFWIAWHFIQEDISVHLVVVVVKDVLYLAMLSLLELQLLSV